LTHISFQTNVVVHGAEHRQRR